MISRKSGHSLWLSVVDVYIPIFLLVLEFGRLKLSGHSSFLKFYSDDMVFENSTRILRHMVSPILETPVYPDLFYGRGVVNDRHESAY